MEQQEADHRARRDAAAFDRDAAEDQKDETEPRQDELGRPAERENARPEELPCPRADFQSGRPQPQGLPLPEARRVPNRDASVDEQIPDVLQVQ